VQDVIVYACHLSPYPYGPYSACLEHREASRVRSDESRSGRLQQVSDILHQMARLLADADSVPVFLMGDFNCPSHLDWTPAAAPLHCGYTIEWPVTLAVEEAGFADSYREIHPDPVADPGNTWSPIYETFTHPGGAREPLDRIDMVHAAGAGVTAIDSEVFLVEPIAPIPDHEDNGWPSDHAAVLSAFSVVLGGGKDLPLATLALNRRSYSSGEPILAEFANGPGNAADWIGLYPAGATPGDPTSPAWAWFYTSNTQTVRGRSGPSQGAVLFGASSAPVWPLPQGKYSAYFFCCDGYTILAGPVAFKVTP
jgi:hypothetical protein